jgi:hypothetical protein
MAYRSSTLEKLENFKEALIEHSERFGTKNGIFAIRNDDYIEILGTKDNSRYIEILLNEGFMKLVKHRKRYYNSYHWSPARYKIYKKQIKSIRIKKDNIVQFPSVSASNKNTSNNLLTGNENKVEILSKTDSLVNDILFSDILEINELTKDVQDILSSLFIRINALEAQKKALIEENQKNSIALKMASEQRELYSKYCKELKDENLKLRIIISNIRKAENL